MSEMNDLNLVKMGVWRGWIWKKMLIMDEIDWVYGDNLVTLKAEI